MKVNEGREKYHLKVGDLLYNKANGIFGIITKKTRHYFYFYINCKESERNGIYMSEERASRQKVYESIDGNILEVYYGSEKRRRKRTSFRED